MIALIKLLIGLFLLINILQAKWIKVNKKIGEKHMNYTVAIRNLGCKVNYYEAVKMQEALINAGYSMVDFEAMADVYIVNTCTVTNIADKKSRQMLHRARNKNSKAIVVAAGCYANVAKKELIDTLDIDLLVSNNEKENIVDIIAKELTERNIKPLYNSNDDEFVDYLKDADSHVRAFLKIQDGCDRFCSYCLIPFARGGLISVPKDKALANAKELSDKGFKELVLTGIHLSSYGKGETEPIIALSDIINDISRIDGIKRIRLGSLEQAIITEDFLNRISDNEKLLPHFHLSLQSGSNNVLKRMNRKYTSEEFLEKCELLRKYYRKVSITTDIIAGFPGETEEEFNETMDFVKKVRFYEAHIFPFSKRNGTRAALMPNQLSNAVKKDRANALIELTNNIRNEYINELVGEYEEILVEEMVSFNDSLFYKGHSKRYVPSYIACTDEKIDLTGRIIRGKIVNNIANGLEIENIE